MVTSESDQRERTRKQQEEQMREMAPCLRFLTEGPRLPTDGDWGGWPIAPGNSLPT